MLNSQDDINKGYVLARAQIQKFSSRSGYGFQGGFSPHGNADVRELIASRITYINPTTQAQRASIPDIYLPTIGCQYLSEALQDKLKKL